MATMVTYMGKVFDFDDPKPESICIEDIAHHLSLINRYNGATCVPYSVAEHCVRMAQADLPGDRLARLLHDAAEAYIGDIISPLKRKLNVVTNEDSYPLAGYEHEIQDIVLRGLGLEQDWRYLNSAGLKEADKRLLAEEVKILMPDTPESRVEFEPWIRGVEPADTGLSVWNVYHRIKAKTLYYNLFMELTK